VNFLVLTCLGRLVELRGVSDKLCLYDSLPKTERTGRELNRHRPGAQVGGTQHTANLGARGISPKNEMAKRYIAVGDNNVPVFVSEMQDWLPGMALFLVIPAKAGIQNLDPGSRSGVTASSSALARDFGICSKRSKEKIASLRPQ
jgi:hypothetical protein